MVYPSLIRPLLFGFDSETVHEALLHAASLPGAALVARAVGNDPVCRDQTLGVSAFGLSFANPIGLAAGFDKNAEMIPVLEPLGFGSLELGTVTAQPQPGNPRPRIFRFPEDRALINRMGFPSRGAEAVAARLRTLGRSQHGVVRGINVGKSKVTPIDDALSDYVISVKLLAPLADYLVINISSPNTPELRRLQEKDRLAALVAGVQSANSERRPLLVKIAPDLTDSEIADILQVCIDQGVAGLITTNTTFSRAGLSQPTDEVGGLSGAPLRTRALGVIRFVYTETAGRLPIVGVGGISTAEHVLDALGAGASMVQIYTGLIYQGPSLVRNLCRALAAWCRTEGVDNIAQVIGTNRKKGT